MNGTRIPIFSGPAAAGLGAALAAAAVAGSGDEAGGVAAVHAATSMVASIALRIRVRFISSAPSLHFMTLGSAGREAGAPRAGYLAAVTNSSV